MIIDTPSQTGPSPRSPHQLNTDTLLSQESSPSEPKRKKKYWSNSAGAEGKELLTLGQMQRPPISPRLHRVRPPVYVASRRSLHLMSSMSRPHVSLLGSRLVHRRTEGEGTPAEIADTWLWLVSTPGTTPIDRLRAMLPAGS